MKITRDMKDTMDVLVQEFAYRIAGGDRKPYRMGDRYCELSHDFIDPPIYNLGLTFTDMIEALDVHTASGANTQTIIFKDGVIKWTKGQPLDTHHATDEDARFYQSIVEEYPQYAEFLAETVQVGQFTVQEPINDAWTHIGDLDDEERFDLYANLIRIAFDLGLRDVHMGNWGFRGYDRTTPVIFDFSDRRPMRSAMTWSRLNAQFEWNNWSNARAYERALQDILIDLNADEADARFDNPLDDETDDELGGGTSW